MRPIFQAALMSLALGLASLAPGCGSDGGSSSEPAPVCAPGATNKCICTGGREGVQICSTDGKGYGACDCGGSAGSAGSAGKAGAAGASGSSAGASGQGGKGGSAGSSGSAGSAGSAGSFPAAGSSGSAGAGQAGGGSSQAGAGGSAGTPSGCSLDDDCKAKAPDSIPPACVVARCSSGQCVFSAPDLDGDKHPDASCKPVLSGDFAPGDDCDDTNPKVFPGAWDGPLGEGKPDACDGKDNDCSGTPDDLTLSDGSSCSCTIGLTRDCVFTEDGTKIEYPGGAPASGSTCKLGTQVCVKGAKGGEWETKCTGAVGPKDKDSCNGLDEDCDGTADSAPCACTVGTSGNCETGLSGKCKGGTRQCGSGGQWGECKPNIAPAANDTCEPGNDDSCNGAPNEGCACINGQQKSCGEVLGSKGICANGTSTCSNGAWGGCSQGPAGELCNGDNVDEDCDGNPLNGCACTNGLTQTVQPKACGTDQQTCVNGGWQTTSAGSKDPYCPPFGPWNNSCQHQQPNDTSFDSDYSTFANSCSGAGPNAIFTTHWYSGATMPGAGGHVRADINVSYKQGGCLTGGEDAVRVVCVASLADCAPVTPDNWPYIGETTWSRNETINGGTTKTIEADLPPGQTMCCDVYKTSHEWTPDFQGCCHKWVRFDWTATVPAACY